MIVYRNGSYNVINKMHLNNVKKIKNHDMKQG